MKRTVQLCSSGSLRAVRIWRAFVGTAAMALAAAHSVAQTSIWQAEAPVTLPAQERAVIDRLTDHFSTTSARSLLIERSTQPPDLPPQVLQRIQVGTSQIAVIPLNILAARFPDFAVFDSLFLFKSLDAVERYETSIDGHGLLESLEKSGLKGLGYLHGGMVQIVSRMSLVASKDFKDLKLGAPMTDSTARQFAALGVPSVQLLGAETLEALERGAVDATEAEWSELLQAGGSNSSFSVLESNHRYRGYVLVANSTTFDKLPNLARLQLLSVAQMIVDDHNAAVKRVESEARQKVLSDIRSAGTVSRSDYDALIGQLKTGAWSTVPSQRRAVARALSISDMDLARKHFATLTPSSPPPIWITPTATPSRPVGSASWPVASAGPTKGLPSRPVILVGGHVGDVESMPTSPRPAQPVPTIVYNADLSPQLPRQKEFPNRPVLKSGQAATLRFDIGRPWTSSILAPVSPPPEILNSKEDVALTVVLACSFCEPHAESLKHITYQPSQRRSNEVRFQFTPQRRPGGGAYVGAVHLLIINDKTGNEHDRLTVDITIDEDGAVPAIALPAADAVVASEPGGMSDWSPDVVLFATEELNRNISIEVEPVSAELKAKIGKLAFDAQGVRRKFLSGVNDTMMMEAMTLSAYGAMSAVSLQGNFLRRLSSTGTDAAVSKESQESLVLTNTESANVAGTIADVGRQLYRHLFIDAQDSDLRNIIGQLEAVAAQAKDRPLRLKIVTNRVSLPWQYLHPVGPDINPAKFWGLRFSLSVLRANTGERHKVVVKGKDLARKVVFAHYGSSADPTVPLAREQMQQLNQIVPALDLLVVDSGVDLLDKALTKQRKNISAIVAFLHASTGAMQPGNSMDTPGPQLSFNDSDIVTSTKLENLLNALTPEELSAPYPYLAGAPLVILNACETGPSTNLPHVSLENAMFQLGAQGVVVTEVSVWLHLGHYVATRLIARLGKGEVISDALTAVRRELYAENKNPLGLLYVYYGDPAATLRH